VWLVTIGRGWQATDALVVNMRDVPTEMLPEPQVTLNYEEEPLLTLKLVGVSAEAREVTASVIRASADRPVAALKRLMEYLESRLKEVADAPSRWVRRFYDLPAVQVGFGSFEIAYGRPRLKESDLFGSRSDLEARDERVIAELERLLSRGLEWATAGEPTNALTKDTEESEAIFQAVYELSPPETGAIYSIQIGGTLAGRQSRGVVLERETRAAARAQLKRIEDARKQKPGWLFAVGIIEATDLGKLSFILRQIAAIRRQAGEGQTTFDEEPPGQELHFEMDEDQADSVMEAQRRQERVVVSGASSATGYTLANMRPV
jgi:hypothetical protein